MSESETVRHEVELVHRVEGVSGFISEIGASFANTYFAMLLFGVIHGAYQAIPHPSYWVTLAGVVLLSIVRYECFPGRTTRFGKATKGR